MKNKVKEFVYSKIVIAITMAIISIITLIGQDSLISYNLHTWIIIPILVIFYNFSIKLNVDEKLKRSSVIFAIIFSFIVVSGRILYLFQNDPFKSFWKELFTIRSLLYLIGNFNLLYCLLINIIPKLYNILKIKIVNKNHYKHLNALIVFVTSFVLIFLGWLPYLLNYFPGTLSPDSFSELNIIINNFASLSDHHTVAHILFIALPFKCGMYLFDNIILAISLVTITQMIIMDLIISYFLKFLYDHKVKIWILVITLLYFMLLPMHGFYSIVMWKDVIFAGCVLLLTIESVKMLEKKQITIKNSISFIIISIFTIFFRNNAIYMYFIFAIVSLIFFRKYIKTFIIMFLIIFGVYFGIKGPVFDYFGITKSSSSEYIGMPMQQIGRMAFKDVQFTEEEKKLIDELIPLDEMKKSYNPRVSDGIKFNKNYKVEVFDNNKFKYLKLWLQLVIKHPAIASEAYLTSTLGYWYPGVEYWSVASAIYENDLGIIRTPRINQKVDRIISGLEDRKTPIINMSWSIGLCFWIIALFAYIGKIRNGIKSLYMFVPVLGIWLTMMVASPVYAEFRYVYSAFLCLPLLIICSLIVKSK